MIDMTALETQDFFKKIKNFAIYKTESNTYELFECYSLVPDQEKTVLTRFSDDSVYNFSSVQTAVTWATLDKLNIINDANQVQRLDQKMSGLIFEMKLHKRMIKDNNCELSFIKLSELKYKLSDVNKQLTTYINRVRDWQMKQFRKKV